MARAQKDVIEVQLIAQMAAAYALAMDFLGRTKRAKDIECGKTANRLVRTYTVQGDTLMSLRRGQVVEVQHVYRDR